MIKLSIVTYNRKDVLRRTLENVEATCPEEHQILVTDNGSIDGTWEMLKNMEKEGRLKAWCLKENLGTAGGRNAHWAECLGFDSVRMDDKVMPQARGWLTSLKVQSDQYHSIVGPPYDPSTSYLWTIAPTVDYVRWDSEQGEGGPLIFIPGEVTEMLGGVDELAPDIKYGWDDCLYIRRARLLGWGFGFSLRVPVQFTASASPERRAKAMEYHHLHVQRLKEYSEAERDLFIDTSTTYGWVAGREARGLSVPVAEEVLE